MASEFVDGEDIKIDEVAEVGVLGTTVATRFIIFSEYAEFFFRLSLAFGHVVGLLKRSNETLMCFVHFMKYAMARLHICR